MDLIIPPANFVCGGYLYPPQTLFVVGILFSRCLSVRLSVTFCFLNILKSHCWIFIKPCKHVHICKSNTLNKKVRVRGQFYKSFLETMFSQNICFQWYHIHKIHTKSPYHRTPVQHCYPVRYLYRYSLCKPLGTKCP